MSEQNQNAQSSRTLFLANITHEFRTPIQTILATLDLLNETNLDQEQIEYLQQMRFSAEALASLVNDFLDFSKLESGQFRFEYIPYNPLQLAEQTVELLAIEAHNKGIEIITDIDFSLPTTIVGDPTRTRQILLNLLKNAVKFTASGYVQVSIVADENARIISFAVKDSGIGVPKDKQDKLFSDFYQTDASTTRKYGGTGLGLSISKNFVQLMGGTIQMQDNPEGGSIFSFNLPYSVPQEVEPKQQPLGAEITANQKLLIVDDKHASAESLVKKLTLLGYTDITFVDSGEKALALMLEKADKNEFFTQLFIDMTMQGMDGWRLASEINNNPKINNAKLYLLIPEGQMGRDAKMKRMRWFNGYLYKPVKKAQLIKLLCDNAADDLELEAVDDDVELTPIQFFAGKELETFGNASFEEDKKPEEKIEDVPKAESNGAGEARAESSAVSAAGTAQPAGEKPAKPVFDQIAKDCTILVAEDHPVNQKLIQTFFTSFGATVICASNGEEAFNKAKENPNVDIIFMDIQMPVMSGLEATKAIREYGIKTPIVACTANTDPSDFDEYTAAGMNDILTKPFKKQSVYDILGVWIKKIKGGNSESSEKGIKKFFRKKEADKASLRAIWNFETFKNNGDSSKEGGKKRIESFTEKAVSVFQKLGVALAADNFAKVQSTISSLKTPAKNIGAEKLYDAAMQMELIAKAGSAVACDTCLKECGMLFDEFTTKTEEWLSHE
ncbi:MAG: response regulator [Treponemataceae bacterium]|nr:response regulator [Treponemataceae bacterium]